MVLVESGSSIELHLLLQNPRLILVHDLHLGTVKKMEKPLDGDTGGAGVPINNATVTDMERSGHTSEASSYIESTEDLVDATKLSPVCHPPFKTSRRAGRVTTWAFYIYADLQMPRCASCTL